MVVAAIVALCLVCLVTFWVSVTSLRLSYKNEVDYKILKQAISEHFDDSRNETRNVARDVDNLYKKLRFKKSSELKPKKRK